MIAHDIDGAIAVKLSISWSAAAKVLCNRSEPRPRNVPVMLPSKPDLSGLMRLKRRDHP
jgi:hypothetical protein